MKFYKLKKMFFVVLSIFFLFLLSCNDEIIITYTDKSLNTSSAEILVNATAPKSLEDTLVNVLGLEENVVLFTQDDVINSMNSTGFEILNLKTIGKMGLSIKLKTKDLLQNFSEVSEAVKFDKNGAEILLNDKIINKFISILPQEASEYLVLLMAPIFVGESMTPEEYIELLSTVYGPTLSDEISKSQVQLTLISPTGKKQYFTEKLVDILCGNAKNTYFIKF